MRSEFGGLQYTYMKTERLRLINTPLPTSSLSTRLSPSEKKLLRRGHNCVVPLQAWRRAKSRVHQVTGWLRWLRTLVTTQKAKGSSSIPWFSQGVPWSKFFVAGFDEIQWEKVKLQLILLIPYISNGLGKGNICIKKTKRLWETNANNLWSRIDNTRKPFQRIIVLALGFFEWELPTRFDSTNFSQTCHWTKNPEENNLSLRADDDWVGWFKEKITPTFCKFNRNGCKRHCNSLLLLNDTSSLRSVKKHQISALPVKNSRGLMSSRVVKGKFELN